MRLVHTGQYSFRSWNKSPWIINPQNPPSGGFLIRKCAFLFAGLRRRYNSLRRQGGPVAARRCPVAMTKCCAEFALCHPRKLYLLATRWLRFSLEMTGAFKLFALPLQGILRARSVNPHYTFVMCVAPRPPQPIIFTF